jgi:hypothetical protein
MLHGRRRIEPRGIFATPNLRQSQPCRYDFLGHVHNVYNVIGLAKSRFFDSLKSKPWLYVDIVVA